MLVKINKIVHLESNNTMQVFKPIRETKKRIYYQSVNKVGRETMKSRGKHYSLQADKLAVRISLFIGLLYILPFHVFEGHYYFTLWRRLPGTRASGCALQRRRLPTMHHAGLKTSDAARRRAPPRPHFRSLSSCPDPETGGLVPGMP